jgi:subtilisin-like proprotein convertase family protein
MKSLFAILALAVAVSPASAIVFSTNWSPNVAVPDANPAGLADARTISGLTGTISDVNVTLNLTGGFNGDLYAYLTHGSGFAILLNRVGRTTGNPFGYSDAGMNVTLDDAAGTDIHLYGTLAAPFVYQPDARAVSPFTVLDTDARTAFLSSFNGMDPNGTWTLFIADLSAGGVTTLSDWGLELTLVPIPEVETYVAAALAGVFGAFWLNRAIWGRRRNSPPHAAS